MIDGAPYMMTPAPSSIHQIISKKIYNQVNQYLQQKDCEIYYSLFDVFFPSQEGKEDKVQPDLFVLCDMKKIGEKGIIGSPDLIIEILSPASIFHDSKIKFELYQRNRVKEYWIVAPKLNSITLFYLKEDGVYDQGEVFENEGTLNSKLWKDLQMDLQEIFY